MPEAFRPLAGRYRFVKRVRGTQKSVIWLALAKDGAQVIASLLPRSRVEGLEPLVGLKHPHLAQVLDVVHDPGADELPDQPPEPNSSVVIVQQLSGRTLHQRLESGPVPLPRVVLWVTRLTRALIDVHERGGVSGAISPRSIIAQREGLVPVLTHIASPPNGAFCSPERVRGDGPSQSDDVWALHATLYTAITRRPPFQAGTRKELAKRILEGAVLPLSHFFLEDIELQKLLENGLRVRGARSRDLRELEHGLVEWIKRGAHLEEQRPRTVPPPPRDTETQDPPAIDDHDVSDGFSERDKSVAARLPKGPISEVREPAGIPDPRRDSDRHLVVSSDSLEGDVLESIARSVEPAGPRDSKTPHIEVSAEGPRTAPTRTDIPALRAGSKPATPPTQPEVPAVNAPAATPVAPDAGPVAPDAKPTPLPPRPASAGNDDRRSQQTSPELPAVRSGWKEPALDAKTPDEPEGARDALHITEPAAVLPDLFDDQTVVAPPPRDLLEADTPPEHDEDDEPTIMATAVPLAAPSEEIARPAPSFAAPVEPSDLAEPVAEEEPDETGLSTPHPSPLTETVAPSEDPAEGTTPAAQVMQPKAPAPQPKKGGGLLWLGAAAAVALAVGGGVVAFGDNGDDSTPNSPVTTATQRPPKPSPAKTEPATAPNPTPPATSAQTPSPQAPASASATSSPQPRPSGDPSACMKAILPEGTFDDRERDLSPMCSMTSPKDAAAEIHSQIVRAGRGKVTLGMKEWSRMGWYQLAVISIMRHQCCSAPEPLKIPYDKGGLCPALTPALDAVGKEMSSGSIDGYTEAINCRFNKQAPRPYRYARPSSYNRNVFEELVKRVRDGR